MATRGIHFVYHRFDLVLVSFQTQAPTQENQPVLLLIWALSSQDKCIKIDMVLVTRGYILRVWCAIKIAFPEGMYSLGEVLSGYQKHQYSTDIWVTAKAVCTEWLFNAMGLLNSPTYN